MYYAHLVTLQQLVETYQHEQPLSLFLKSFFRANKKYGSRDRKIITHHIFNYYRLGKTLPDADFQTRLQVASYLADNIIVDEKINETKPLNNSDNLEERIATVKKQFPEFDFETVFPLTNELSNGVDKIAFAKSILSRQKVFIRIRKGFEEKVKEELSASEFQFEIINPFTFSFEQETKITETKSFEKGWFEIQDLSSQQTGNFFKAKPEEHWWDCCAGAGGKSLLFKDKFPDTYLLVSDARENILINALARLKKTGVKKYKIETIDLENSGPGNIERSRSAQTPTHFDGIIVDAPCSGSGTWSRTPENISFFKKEMIDEFQTRQVAIVKNAIEFLKPDGQLIYITCSAFRKENEVVTEQILQLKNLEKTNEQIFTGYSDRADTMYAACFKKSKTEA